MQEEITSAEASMYVLVPSVRVTLCCNCLQCAAEHLATLEAQYHLLRACWLHLVSQCQT